MPAPFLAPAAVSAIKSLIAAKAGGRRPGRRRRTRGLTQKAKNDLMWLRQNIGRTAAANYLSRRGLG